MRNRLKALSLLLGSTFLCLLGLEIALRLIGYNPFADLVGGRELILRESENPILKYELTPNTEGYAWNTDVRINAYGFRDRDYVAEVPEGTYRILAIGDSVTFGNDLPIDQTFPKRLEDLFHAQKLAVEVLNLGIGGYDTVQEVAFLEDTGLMLHPDEVIVGYCMNDVGVMSTNLDFIRRARSYGRAVFRFRVLQFVRTKLDHLEAKRSSHVSTVEHNGFEEIRADILSDAYITTRTRQIEEYLSTIPVQPIVLPWYTDFHGLSKLRTGFERLKQLSRLHGFKVSVVIIPFIREQVEADRAAYEIVRHEAQRNQFDVIEPLQKFVEAGITRLQMSPIDPLHPNELGHRLIAEGLFEFYLQESNRQLVLNSE